MKNVLVASAAVAAIALYTSIGFAAAPKSACVGCHIKVTPGIVQQFRAGKMSKVGVDCSTCHGSRHTHMSDAKLAQMPTIETCAKCHPQQAAQFKAGKHYLAWVAMTAMPMLTHQPTPVVAQGYKGCSYCHKIGYKTAAERAKYRYGNAECDACHTRHTFKKSEALDPRASQTCHEGFDHPQWEMWSTSKHGTIWEIERSRSKRAPTCQTCHMPGGDHMVITAWGFLALRLPEKDKAWNADQVTILQALGVLDQNGKPTARFAAVKAARLARLTEAGFKGPRERMIKVCSRCHSESYAVGQLQAGDQVVKDSDRVMAEAIRTVQGLYKDGILKKPANWVVAPDLLQFYEAKTTIEQHLYVMFMEYRMRTFEGAFHMNPDYMHWYGWAKMKETLRQIKDEAAQLRAEPASEAKP
jgi:hydroxylamine dehydrogenase